MRLDETVLVEITAVDTKRVLFSHFGKVSGPSLAIIEAVLAGKFNCGGCLGRTTISGICCHMQAEVEESEWPCEKWEWREKSDPCPTCRGVGKQPTEWYPPHYPFKPPSLLIPFPIEWDKDTPCTTCHGTGKKP